MSYAHRNIANSSALLRRGQYLRHPVMVARTSAIPWGQGSWSCWSFNARPQSQKSLRSYASKVNRSKGDQSLQALKAMMSEQAAAELDLSRQLPWKASSYAPPDPEVRFDQSESAPQLTWTQGIPVYSLEGYSSDAENIRIYFKVGHFSKRARPMELSKLYLRDICQCRKCISPSSGRKTFATCDIPRVPRLRNPDTESIRLAADGGLEITWEDDFLTGDTHTSVYSQEFLNHLDEYDGKTYNYRPPSRTLWNKTEFQHGMGSRIITFSDWMEGGAEFAQAILDLHIRGLVFMREVPRSRHSVQRIAEKIGNLSSTIRGLTWDVISEPESQHMADHNQHLRLHQDLLYSNNTPQVKFLHCLENECQGGLSLFSDGLHAAAQLQREDKRSFKALSLHPATFSCDKAGHYLTRRRRVIEAGIGQPIRSVSWSPAFQTPFRVKEHRQPSLVPATRRHPNDEMLRIWSKAARIFRDSLESPENVVQHRLQPGDCVIFDNTRVLHGRTPVDASAGLRHLRGAYIDGETLKSATIHLNNKGLLKPDYHGELHELWRRSLEEDASRDFGSLESVPGLCSHLK